LVSLLQEVTDTIPVSNKMLSVVSFIFIKWFFREFFIKTMP
jgi:hypothetical protein